jgi:phage nucleotide-binding protein
MAIALKRTSQLGVSQVKFLVYGMAGAGKTSLIATLPNPIVLSAEAGLLSLKGADVPYIEINTMADLYEAYEWATSSEEAKHYESIALDSISEIGEVVLAAEKKVKIDGKKIHGMKAYGEMQDKMADLIRAFRDLPNRHVYFSAKMEKSTDELGCVSYAPSLPGNKFAQQLPYFFDEVFALRIESFGRALLTQTDGLWSAKDRSGRLERLEPPDLGAIIKKIGGAE